MKCIQCYRSTPYSWVIFLGFAIFALLSAKPIQAGPPPEWVKIGEKKVNRKLDRDEILIANSNDRFTAIQFRVTRSEANIARCSIQFDKGREKIVKLGQNLAEGQRSKVIKLGLLGPRSVKKVVVWYDTSDDADKKAIVEIWGRK
ncbi:MAG: hypothetical protein H6563_10200 [Lewinellaceae bacterium]|nr:hypothetical protein [Lewinellaceae bacterium]